MPSKTFRQLQELYQTTHLVDASSGDGTDAPLKTTRKKKAKKMKRKPAKRPTSQ